MKLHVTRQQADSIGRAFVTAQGANLSGYKQATVFDGNTEALVFLQRTLGLDSASAWARTRVPIWTWDARWFKPQAKEEWRVAIGVDGAVARFTHLVEEAGPGANLTQDSARALAERFVASRGWNLKDFTPVEASSEKKDKRTDHHFSWEEKGSTVSWREGSPTAGSGSVRVAVDIAGDRIGAYRHVLKVPEEFSRSLQQTQSIGGLLGIAALLLTFVLVLAALGIAIARQKKGDIHWHAGLVLATCVSVLFLGAGITMWPSVKFSYQTEMQWAAYVGVVLIGALFVSALYGLWTLFTVAAGESLGRATFPASLEGFLDAARGRMLTPAFAAASLRGYALGFLILGYLTLFYLFARRFLGAWLPAEGPQSEIFNNYAPFIAPLTISLVAAITEETTYRLFGISLVKRYLKSTALALLIPAVIWAFAHSSYAVFPIYIRGIELTIAGLMFGIAFLRLGLL
ncbi:MAG TPA: type II CAAX endopeptidase family protein, partial [Gemmatimonadales bacterium]|nr:type II CAAX endopeptidase family protein [Gemmatimonadales bacterium]